LRLDLESPRLPAVACATALFGLDLDALPNRLSAFSAFCWATWLCFNGLLVGIGKRLVTNAYLVTNEVAGWTA